MKRRMPRPRLLPVILLACAGLALVKAQSLWRALPGEGAFVSAAAASAPPSTPAHAAPAPPPPPPPPDPVDQAERALLGRLRERRAEIEAKEAAFSARESVLAAAERRLTARLEEMAALQSRLEALERGRGEREEAGWRGLVKTYEAMRPRDAATVFDELEMPVLLQIVNRMREAKAAPVIGAMRPDRARSLTAELARLRAATNRPD
ncbi:MotE family protein [Muricoccus vinaceus]|uniref:MotE family protein n=1 Tax=Muricoccus vinaceus TaxID=424704 RepID=A0ABV6IYV0_9PROT